MSAAACPQPLERRVKLNCTAPAACWYARCLAARGRPAACGGCLRTRPPTRSAGGPRSRTPCRGRTCINGAYRGKVHKAASGLHLRAACGVSFAHRTSHSRWEELGDHFEVRGEVTVDDRRRRGWRYCNKKKETGPAVESARVEQHGPAHRALRRRTGPIIHACPLCRRARGRHGPQRPGTKGRSVTTYTSRSVRLSRERALFAAAMPVNSAAKTSRALCGRKSQHRERWVTIHDDAALLGPCARHSTRGGSPPRRRARAADATEWRARAAASWWPPLRWRWPPRSPRRRASLPSKVNTSRRRGGRHCAPICAAGAVVSHPSVSADVRCFRPCRRYLCVSHLPQPGGRAEHRQNV